MIRANAFVVSLPKFMLFKGKQYTKLDDVLSLGPIYVEQPWPKGVQARAAEYRSKQKEKK